MLNPNDKKMAITGKQERHPAVFRKEGDTVLVQDDNPVFQAGRTLQVPGDCLGYARNPNVFRPWCDEGLLEQSKIILRVASGLARQIGQLVRFNTSNRCRRWAGSGWMWDSY